LSAEEAVTAVTAPGKEARDEQAGIRLCFSYSKTGEAKYFGHLEMVNIFTRALRRMGLPLQFSKGFHPMPKVSFENPLPIGMESMEERFFVCVSKDIDLDDLANRMNREIPAGLSVKDCRLVSKKKRKPLAAIDHYVITLQEGLFEKDTLDRFLCRTSFYITRTNKKGQTKTIDLKDVVFRVAFIRPNSLSLDIKQSHGNIVRPAEFLKNVFGLSEVAIKKASIIKGITHVQADYY
jgi:radical SAM-linked protein